MEKRLKGKKKLFTCKSLGFQVVANEFRSVQAKVVEVSIVHDVRISFEREWQLVGLDSRRLVPSVVDSVLELVEAVVFILLRQPNLLDGDVVLLDGISQPSAVHHVQIVVENRFADLIQHAILSAVG